MTSAPELLLIDDSEADITLILHGLSSLNLDKHITVMRDERAHSIFFFVGAFIRIANAFVTSD
jgi:hypothetical protein